MENIEEKDVFINLKDDSADRRKILKEVNNRIDKYSYQIIDYENKIKEYELMEIKYKNLSRETIEKEDIYQKRIDILKEENEALREEIVDIKKQVISKESEMSFIKSILQILVKEYGIARVAEITDTKEQKITDCIEE